MKEPELRDLNLADLENPTFFQTLAELAECNASLETLTELYYNLQHRGIRTMVMVIDNKVIGTGSVVIMPKFIHTDKDKIAKVAQIEDVAVHKDYKRNGFGRSIVEFLINIAKDAQCYKVILNCAPNLTPFYEALGFRKHEYEMRLDL